MNWIFRRRQNRRAVAVYHSILRMMKQEKIRCAPDRRHLAINGGFRGAALPIDFRIAVEAAHNRVLLLSRLPFAVDSGRQVDVAMGVAYVNSLISDGSFDYDMQKESLMFRLVACYGAGTADPEFARYILFSSCSAIAAYDRQLLLLSQGDMEFDRFVKAAREVALHS